VSELNSVEELFRGLSLAKIPSAFVFIAFQSTRVGKSKRLLTVKASGYFPVFRSNGVLARHRLNHASPKYHPGAKGAWFGM
jgi:hypothetical protein